jgi:hypothetical protein
MTTSQIVLAIIAAAIGGINLGFVGSAEQKEEGNG